MNSAILQDRLAQYQPRDKLEELRAVKEIAQEIALAGLCRAGLFEQASFQGGTCLRIVHRLSRFSEDLDFALHNADATFHWPCLFRELEEEFRSFGLHLEASDRSQANQAVKKAFLKEDSFGQVLKLNFPRLRSDPQKVLIKLEVDTNPPSHCTSQISYIDFPYPFSVTCHDLSSLFAGKCHALLCRGFVKGRDWFDFLWYVSRETV
ncbi:MAG: nucleotidyl transferase AbiEii/AbiGii toxin family protein, partial [Chlamydiia bacterium]|nr:nucleotidyl transferase AbiEii/AbiGii toxin family protein [Chlamydiia bacterium]